MKIGILMREIVLLQLNDLHGYMEQHSEWFWDATGFTYRMAGGLARIKTIVDGIRRQHSEVMLTDNGDTFHGTRAVVESKGAMLVPILNTFGFAGMTGHWDFAYGPAELQRLVSDLNYPFLAANVYSVDDGSLIFPACRKVSLGAVRVGLIGLACNIVDKTMPPSFSEGVRFTDGVTELPRYIEQMREKENVDIVVLLSHLGLPQDIALLERVPGVDVCLSSHTHNRLEKPIQVGKTVLIQSGCHGSFVGMLRLQLRPERVAVLEHQLITVEDDVAEDAEVQGLIDVALEPSRVRLGDTVGSTPIALNRATMLESTADTFLLDAMIAATGAQIAFANGWRYGAPIPEGKITLDALYNLAPMDPEITLVDLSGKEIWEMLEENLERTFSRQPFGHMGGYVKRCAGMTMFFKAENPNGSRLQDVFVGSARIQAEHSYRAAYITMQAVPSKYGTNRQSTGVHLINALTVHLRENAVASGDRHSVVEV
jgi:2',3'-cyclic-nucleotide 2'-phosphodiesterase (5'-nucleotidase family)